MKSDKSNAQQKGTKLSNINVSDNKFHTPSSHAFSLDPRFYFPHFQPIVDIPSGCIFGYESLTRTYNDKRAIVSAGAMYEDETIDAKSRLNIDRIVRQKALKRFCDEPNGEMLFLNISPIWVTQLDSREEPPTLTMIKEVGIDPSRVVIEITEKLGDIDKLESLVTMYRNHGLKIAIDDFGVGGSQVDRLIALSPDYIKIDMGIFKDASRNGKSANFLLSLSALSAQADFEIICEGVETEEEFDFAIECGAQKIQGWLFSKAEENLLMKDSTREAVEFLQSLYLDRKKNIVAKAAKRSAEVAKYVSLINEYHQQDEMSKANAGFFHDAGIIRYYICNVKGKQISPNYNFVPFGVEIDNAMLGHYWSHRPYFPVAMGIRDTIKRNRIVSKSYVDTTTRKLCKTTMMSLGDGTVLLVDALVHDSVLYCRQH